MSELDRPRLALYVALGVIVCLLGARYLRTQVLTPGPDGGAAVPAASTAPAGSGTASGDEAAGSPDGARGRATVQLDRAGGGRLTVHVAGAVRHPGVYRLPAGARVDDALRRAGGPSGRADLTAVNLASKLEDARQVLVPVRAPPAAGSGAVPGGDGATAPGAPPAPINLNTATLEQLDTLDGVGPGIAQRILDYREQHGGFRRVEDLGEVAGIGDKRLATLMPLVTV